MKDVTLGQLIKDRCKIDEDDFNSLIRKTKLNPNAPAHIILPAFEACLRCEDEAQQVENRFQLSMGAALTLCDYLGELYKTAEKALEESGEDDDFEAEVGDGDEDSD